MRTNHEDTSVRIECVTSKTDLPLTFTAKDTVHDLKAQISRMDPFGRPAVISQRLVSNGITLQDEWGLRPEWLGGTTVYLVIDSAGGTMSVEQVEADIIKLRSEIKALRKELTASRNRTAILEWRIRHTKHNPCPKFDGPSDDI
jgi:hypothetical protein